MAVTVPIVPMPNPDAGFRSATVSAQAAITSGSENGPTPASTGAQPFVTTPIECVKTIVARAVMLRVARAVMLPQACADTYAKACTGRRPARQDRQQNHQSCSNN